MIDTVSETYELAKLLELKLICESRITDEARQTLKGGYLQPGEEAFDMYARLARNASIRLLAMGFREDLYLPLLEVFCKGYLSPATPVASNFGLFKRSVLPISCYAYEVTNSVDGIYSALHEGAMLSKGGGGLGCDLSNVVGTTPVNIWAKSQDNMANSVSQGGVRRGAIAIYCDAYHPDIDALLHSKDMLKGDIREKLDCNIAVKLSDAFMQNLLANKEYEHDVFSKILELRMTQGSPYIFFSDTVAEDDPEWYKDKGLKTKTSNLCSEIMLHTDDLCSFVCCLSSINLDLFGEWAFESFGGYSVVELGVFFLDAVMEEFIEKTEGQPGFEKVRRSAIKGRPLGLGTLGLHSYLQSLGLTFGDPSALMVDTALHGYIRNMAESATELLAERLGEPEWCKGYGRRNTHLLAIAPTTTNSVLCNAGSPGIEPAATNYYSVTGSKGTFIRKNKHLQEVLREKFPGDDAKISKIWKEIAEADGSVQKLDCLSDKEKNTFRTAMELDQADLLKHASCRQAFIDQGQSLNLFLPPDMSAEDIARLHILAWKLKIKTLYYVRSKAKLKQKLDTLQSQPRVHMLTRPDCVWCNKAKDLLKQHAISWTEQTKPEGRVPIITYNGRELADGYQSLKQILEPQDESTPVECSGCEG